MATYFEPQVFKEDDGFFLTITTSTAFDSQWTALPVRINAVTWDAAVLEGVNKTLDYAAAVLNVDRAVLLKVSKERRAIGWDDRWVKQREDDVA